MFTVKQLSKIAGITPRTLHYYDEIGLLKPSQVGANGYRYYGEEALLRLQQILLYRELDLPLEHIKEIVEHPDFDVLSALESHRQKLRQRIMHMERLIGTVDDTISHLKGQKRMTHNSFLKALAMNSRQNLRKRPCRFTTQR
jgi:DNA-binding transcriptional MerR regulator